ncbi:MAG: hypothetical protein EOO92_27735 [Pedobacter sp.]|nr:MAG: hypothetical protein EOO92_27735 [Pedobacter sp.]
MKRISLLLIISCLLVSCGTFRKVFKLKESSSTEQVSEVKTDIQANTAERTVTKITEKADTTITTPEKVVKQDTYLNKDSLIKGMNAIHNDLVDVRLKLDPVTGILSATATVKPQSVSVLIDRITEVEKQLQEDIKVAEIKNSSLKTEAKSNRVEKEPAKMGMWFAIAALIVLVVGAIIWFRVKK